MRQQRKDGDLEQRVRRDLSFLFDEYGALVTSNTIVAAGISQVSVAAGKLEFQFSKNERDGDNVVKVGPRNGLGIWELLPVALAASTGEDPKTLSYAASYNDNSSLLSYVGFTKLASLLRTRFKSLNEAFAPENYAATRLIMAQIERKIHSKD